MWAMLLDKTVIIDGQRREVYGLADFHCRPSRRGIGSKCLKAFEKIAKDDGKYCLVGFTMTESDLQFYLKAGYHFCGLFKNEYLFTSIPVKNIIVGELW